VEEDVWLSKLCDVVVGTWTALVNTLLVEGAVKALTFVRRRRVAINLYMVG
jgi:hypothetical protein